MKPHLQTTVFTLLAAGRSQREIARITKIDRKTIRALAQRFAGAPANSPGVATGPVTQIPPPRPPGSGRQSVSACEPHREFIQAQLRLRRNFTAIYQDLVDQFGFGASYNSVSGLAPPSSSRTRPSSIGLSLLRARRYRSITAKARRPVLPAAIVIGVRACSS